MRNVHDLGRTFKGEGDKGRRNVYDCHRRYTRMNDPRRNMDYKNTLHFVDDKRRPWPKKRTYAEYMENANEAEESGKPVNGVHGRWPLHILPYAQCIHWSVDYMHTMNNVVTDSLNSLRPSHTSGKATKWGKMYQHTNRTFKSGVIKACQKDGIHAHLSGGGVPPWVLSKESCLQKDHKLNRVIGSFTSEEMTKDIMRAGHMNRSHDTIHWANTYAQWCLGKSGPCTDNILEIFDIISILNANNLHGPTMQHKILPRLIDALIIRSGLVPPSECCVTLHEMMHVCEQVLQIGTPRNSLLYKFEKLNKILKGFLQNAAKGNQLCI